MYLKKKRKIMLQETIFNLKDLTKEERDVILYPNMDKGEYFARTSQKKAYFDLFWVFRYRGDFKMARKYEILSDHDAILSLESSGSDCFMKNEYEYYEWRKKNP